MSFTLCENVTSTSNKNSLLLIMGKKKILNDPIYGLIHFPYEIIYTIIDHPFFQRLRRIHQMGFAHYVYPGATHTRFQHTLGAMHLMKISLQLLKSKGTNISKEEELAALLAILFHDIGHGPFSHALEGMILPYHHEELSLMMMDYFEKELGEDMQLAKSIFKGSYSRSFFHSLVSSQLDVDRLDYLTRDSFYTGVVEGNIGYDRLIMMMNVKDDQLVIEEKAIASIENFLLARRMMYQQVYLHKAAISIEHMSRLFLKRLKEVISNEKNGYLKNEPIVKVLIQENLDADKIKILEKFSELDDIDFLSVVKKCKDSGDITLSFLSKSILERRLFKITYFDKALNGDLSRDIRLKIVNHLKVSESTAEQLISKGQDTNEIYTKTRDEILVLTKTNQLRPFSSYMSLSSLGQIRYNYLLYPIF